MTTTNTRIKKLRRSLDLTQAEFASRIGTSQNSLAGYETGRRNPSSSVINNICKEFHVSEKWLRTGEGDMLLKRSRDDEITAFVDDVLRDEPESFRKRLITMLSRLDHSDWVALEEKARELVGAAADQAGRPPWAESPPDAIGRSRTPADAAAAKQAQWEKEADEFAAIAREQYLSEKLQASQASSARESGGPGGVA